MGTVPILLISLASFSCGRRVLVVPGPPDVHAASVDPLQALAARLLASRATAGWQATGPSYRLAKLARQARDSQRFLPSQRRSVSCVACDALPSDAEDSCDVDLVDRREALEFQLMKLAATTNRGAAQNDSDDERLGKLISELDCLGPPDVSTGALDGSWRLAYASCPAYRSSPFFWAYGQLAEGLKQPIFSVTDGLPFYRVGVARQKLTDTASSGTLVSAVELTVFVFDALLPPLRGIVTTTTSARPDGADPSSLILEVQTTEVKQSDLPFTENIIFPSAEVLESFKAGSTTVRMSTSYLSTNMRISRNPDGDVFVYVRE